MATKPKKPPTTSTSTSAATTTSASTSTVQNRNKNPTSFRLSPEALHLLGALAELTGASMATVLEMLIRERARKENIK